MIDRKTPEEIGAMREGGRKLGKILKTLLDASLPGTNLLTLEETAMKEIFSSGGTPSFTTVADYKWATCLCVNEVIVHAIPKSYVLKDGDVLTIDIGMIYGGFHTDTAWTKVIKNSESRIKNLGEIELFLKSGEKAMWDGIAVSRIGNRVGDLSRVIDEEMKRSGYQVTKTLVGHGVGRTLHEEPQIPGYVRGELKNTPKLIGGETLAVEVIYAMGSGVVVYDNDDGWTLSTKDGSLSAVFEHTIAVTSAGPEVLTLMPRQSPNVR
ncbi:type I methionyl aminopeptidase [Candidatus Gottesmanbacteria bacterium]|nr:type I methionyl aminopeptidase [Candidatus Gottesmanbacteria bacterium]